MSGYSSGYESEAASSECPSVEEAEKEPQQRRVRTKFTTEQIAKLEKIFSKHKYLDAGERMKTAQRLGLTETQVGRPRPPPWKPSRESAVVLSASSSLPGQNLVPEPEDEAEAGDAGLLCCGGPAGDVPAAARGPVPAPPLPPPRRTGRLPPECPADGPPDTPAVLLLNNDY